MAHVFLSHSSKDKEFVRQLHADLKAVGHNPWLDEWEIKVGQCIVTKVERAIAESDFVVLVLSPHAVESGWVDREWKAKYWAEIDEKKTAILPVLLEDCAIPTLLKTRRYADFRTNRTIGFMHLADAIGMPVLKPVFTSPAPEPGPTADDALLDLIARVQDENEGIAACVATALGLARKLGNAQLRIFCERELSGYEGPEVEMDEAEFPRHRLIQTFYSMRATINTGYMGWGTSFANALAYMQRDGENFSQLKTLIGQPIATLEAKGRSREKAGDGLLHWTRKLGDFIPGSASPEHPVHFYAAGDAYAGIINGVRAELTKYLLAMLPEGSPPRDDQ